LVTVLICQIDSLDVAGLPARGKAPGKAWIKPMTLETDEFIRRFLLHVLPSGFHSFRHLNRLSV
jgi:hypothetical protein